MVTAFCSHVSSLAWCACRLCLSPAFLVERYTAHAVSIQGRRGRGTAPAPAIRTVNVHRGETVKKDKDLLRRLSGDPMLIDDRPKHNKARQHWPPARQCRRMVDVSAPCFQGRLRSTLKPVTDTQAGFPCGASMAHATTFAAQMPARWVSPATFSFWLLFSPFMSVFFPHLHPSGSPADARVSLTVLRLHSCSQPGTSWSVARTTTQAILRHPCPAHDPSSPCAFSYELCGHASTCVHLHL